VVFAVPGHPLDPRAEGTNKLLKEGATIATEPDDVIEALAPMVASPTVSAAAGVADPGAVGLPASVSDGDPAIGPQDRARVLSALGPAPVDIDELVRATGLPARVLQIALIELALAGRIERHGHQLISLVDGNAPDLFA
jgi:DNA processing protein